MATAWRLVKTKFANKPLSADGARLYGGRWNSPGVPVVYLAESISLAVLEVLVHLEAARLLESYSLVRVDFDATTMHSVDIAALPSGWAEFPAGPASQEVGDDWVLARTSAWLRVPSAIVPLEHLLVLNPIHTDTSDITVAAPIPFRFDPRLIG
jgi:RES domain-containing protein